MAEDEDYLSGCLKSHIFCDTPRQKTKKGVNAVRQENSKSVQKCTLQSEHSLQVFIIKIFSKHCLTFTHANNSSKSKNHRLDLWRLGVKAGVADILIFDRLSGTTLVRSKNENTKKPVQRNHSEVRLLAFELKTKKGRVSKKQHAWSKEVAPHGVLYCVIRSVAEAMAVCSLVGIDVGNVDTSPGIAILEAAYAIWDEHG